MSEPTEIEIQEALELLKKTSSNEVTRERAIQIVNNMRALAGMVVDRIDDDLKIGRVKVSDDGKVTRESKDE